MVLWREPNAPGDKIGPDRWQLLDKPDPYSFQRIGYRIVLGQRHPNGVEHVAVIHAGRKPEHRSADFLLSTNDHPNQGGTAPVAGQDAVVDAIQSMRDEREGFLIKEPVPARDEGNVGLEFGQQHCGGRGVGGQMKGKALSLDEGLELGEIRPSVGSVVGVNDMPVEIGRHLPKTAQNLKPLRFAAEKSYFLDHPVISNNDIKGTLVSFSLEGLLAATGARS